MAVIGAIAVGGIALQRGEQINSMWLIIAAICVYALGYRFYRFYSTFIASKVLILAAASALSRFDGFGL